MRDQEKELKNDDADSEAEEEDVDEDEGGEEAQGEKQVTGKIIGVAKRNWRPLVLPPSSLVDPLFDIISALQVRLPHRRSFPPIDRSHLGRSPDRFRHTPRLSTPSDPASDPPGPATRLSEDSRLNRPVGPNVALPRGSLRSQSGRDGEQECGAGESAVGVRGALPTLWKVDLELSSERGRHLGRSAQGQRPSWGLEG